MQSIIIDTTDPADPGAVLHRSYDTHCELTRAGRLYLGDMSAQMRYDTLQNWHDGAWSHCRQIHEVDE